MEHQHIFSTLIADGGWGTYYCTCGAKAKRSISGELVEIIDDPLDPVFGAIERKAQGPTIYDLDDDARPSGTRGIR